METKESEWENPKPCWSSKNPPSTDVAQGRIRYVVLGFGGERAGLNVWATIDHTLCLQFKRTRDGEQPQPKNNKNPQIDPTHMLDFALNSSWSRSWTFATCLLRSAS